MSALEIPRKIYIYNTQTYTRTFTLVIHTGFYSNHQKLQDYYDCLPNAPCTHAHAHAHTYIHIYIHTRTRTRTHPHAMYACKHTTKISKYYTNHLKFSASPKSPGMDFWMYIIWSKEPPPPGGVSYLLCSLIKNREQEDPPWRTTHKMDQFWGLFFRGGSLPAGSWLRSIVNRKPPRWGGFLSIPYNDCTVCTCNPRIYESGCLTKHPYQYILEYMIQG